jgi:hypothetical protein
MSVPSVGRLLTRFEVLATGLVSSTPATSRWRTPLLLTKRSDSRFYGDAADASAVHFSPDYGAKDLRQLQCRWHA